MEERIHQPDVSNDRVNIRATVHVTALPVIDHITMVIGVPSHFVYILIKGYLLLIVVGLDDIYWVFRNLWDPLRELIVHLKIMKKSHVNISPICLCLRDIMNFLF